MKRPSRILHDEYPCLRGRFLKKEVSRLEKESFIERSDSHWSAQTVLVKQKDGSWRKCVDYRKLNEKKVKDTYPIPRIDDNLDALSGAKWFTTLDCNMAYHQVPMEEEDKLKTAFATPIGGLINSQQCLLAYVTLGRHFKG